jgi:ABC-type branched-subunit amino acid transport system substrate-binding protein
MSHRLNDERLDARWTAFLGGAAEDGAARARTPEQVAAEIEQRTRLSSRIGLRVPGVLRLAWLVIIATLLLALLAWLVAGGRLPSVVPTRVVRIAIELPLGGSDSGGAAIADGVMLAVNDANGRTGRFRIEIPEASIVSDLADGVPDAATGAANMRRIVAAYFGGSGEAGATVLNATLRAGMGEIPFVGTDALHDGSQATPGSFLSLAGPGASRAFAVFPGSPGGPDNDAFTARYRSRYGVDPTPFAAAGYACGQVVIAALQRVDASSSAATARLREVVRAAGVDPETTFQTVLGPIAFDASGDVMPRLVTIYAYDGAARDWAVAK